MALATTPKKVAKWRSSTVKSGLFYRKQFHNHGRIGPTSSMMLYGHTIWLLRLLGTTPFRLIYGKPCYLPIELEHKAYSTVKFLKFDLKAVGEKRLLQLNELEKIRSDAYESSRIYKKKIKR